MRSTQVLTTMRYLIDTDWIIDVLRRTRGSRERVSERLGAGIGVSMITIAELYVGPYKGADPQSEAEPITIYLAHFSTLPVDEETCEIFGQVKARLELDGQPIGDFDTMIAATALQHNLILLTNNIKHFERVDGLSIESG